jgi:hypothetical protein
MAESQSWKVPHEHPVVEALITNIRKYSIDQGKAPPDPFVIPKRMFRAIAVAAHEGQVINSLDRIELTIPIDQGISVTLQPEGWIEGTRVPWKWLFESAAKQRRHLVR